MNDWNWQQHYEQKNQCKCREVDGKKVTCKSCREFLAVEFETEQEYELPEQTDFLA